MMNAFECDTEVFFTMFKVMYSMLFIILISDSILDFLDFRLWEGESVIVWNFDGLLFGYVY